MGQAAFRGIFTIPSTPFVCLGNPSPCPQQVIIEPTITNCYISNWNQVEWNLIVCIPGFQPDLDGEQLGDSTKRIFLIANSPF